LKALKFLALSSLLTACLQDPNLSQEEQPAFTTYCSIPTEEVCYNQFEGEFGVRWTTYCCHVDDQTGVWYGCGTRYGRCIVSDWPAGQPDAGPSS
jgi:hypothetical protein